VLELTLRVGAGEAEGVLDAVLPTLPGGTHVREAGEAVELTIAATPGTPDEKELRRLVGSRLIGLTEAEASDDWRERRLARYQPLIVAERFLLRPDWAPPGEDRDLIEITLEQTPAFGTGLHPTTQACLATMAELDPGGSFADLGCGSGVLSIAAAKLGWSPVIAADIAPASVASAGHNAERNRVEIDVRVVDVTAEIPPEADTVVANIPPAVQVAMAERLGRTPAVLIASGFRPDEIPAVASAWEQRELTIADEVQANEWSVLVMRR
jgi:ribosomal protein L11 methyltransferase